MWATIVFNKKDPCCFTYAVPEKWQSTIQVFQRVYVELVETKTVGIILKLSKDRINLKSKSGARVVQLKEILKIIDQQSILNQEQFSIAEFISRYYLASIGQAIFKMIPAGKRESVYISESKNTIEKMKVQPLLKEQKEIINLLQARQSSVEQSPVTHLIFGITGSGKTRIYLELINENLKKKVGSIFLLPEIALTYQFVTMLKPYYGEKMVVLHSNLAKSERLREYRKLQNGEALLAVGTRSAVFAPVQNLGLIILDEEHDQSYKENHSPKYHARTVAWFRLKEAAKKNKQPNTLILGSATPSAESYARVLKKTIYIYYLKKRATALPLPKIHLVSHNIFSEGISIFSPALLVKIDEHLKNDKQVLLLLNRRGYSNFLYCETCKKNISCQKCSITLTYHRSNLNKHNHKNFYVKCHLCGYEAQFEKNCAVCQKPLSMMGKGIQKVEDALEAHFPKIEYARLDQDNARSKGYVVDVLEAMRQNKIKILIGTQMIAKGFDLPNVTLVGILNADIGLNLPDFRAVERVAQLLIQASGRAGRYSMGEVIMQTMQNESDLMKKVSSYQYEEFLKEELLLRKYANFPPYSRFVRILLRCESLEKLRLFCNHLEEFIQFNSSQKTIFDKDEPPICVESVCGPMPASIEKIKDEYRYQLLLKDKKTENLIKSTQIIKAYLQKKGGVKYDFDIDPIDLL